MPATDLRVTFTKFPVYFHPVGYIQHFFSIFQLSFSATWRQIFGTYTALYTTVTDWNALITMPRTTNEIYPTDIKYQLSKRARKI